MAKISLLEKRTQRNRTKLRKVAGEGRLRLTIARKERHIYAQVIDDVAGKTVAAASSVEKELRKSVKSGANVKAATEVGKLIAERAKKAGVSMVYFDRGGHLYHGRVKALADAAREGGLEF